MTPVVSATLLLMASNVFMTFAWYAHLKNLADRPWYVAAVASWGYSLVVFNSDEKPDNEKRIFALPSPLPAKAAPQAINAATSAVVIILLRIGGTSVSGWGNRCADDPRPPSSVSTRYVNRK